VSRRTILVGLALVVVLALPGAGQAESAQAEPPIEVTEPTIEAEIASLLFQEGNASLAASTASGSLTVWEQRTPCVEPDPDSCLEGQSETARTSSSLDRSSLRLTPREEADHVSFLATEDESRFRLSAGQADLGIRAGEEVVRLTEDDDAPADMREAELPRGLDVPVEGADVQLEGSITLQTVGSELVVEPNGTEDPRTIVTGVTWQEDDDGVYYRTLRLASASFEGGLSAAWDGSLLATPQLPATVRAPRAQVNVTEGQLGTANASTSPTQLADAELTITGIAWQGETGRFVVQQGSQPVAAPDDSSAEEGVSTTTLVGAGSAAAAAALLTAYYWPRLSWVATALVLPLYSRIEKDELFENETREQLYEEIKDDPGIHAHALSEAVDIGWGTTVYHLRRLERNGFVNSEKRGRYRRFFPASGFMERQREVLSVLQNETTEDIAALVREDPGLNQSAICDELDISPSLANWHLNRLIDAELVDRERRGRTVHYTPGEAWEALERAAEVEAAEVPGDAQAA
jgi:DNA-binding transcriptional ArsR family regulator